MFDLCINYQFRINNLCKKVSYWNGLLKVFKLEKDFLIIGVNLFYNLLIKEFNCDFRLFFFFFLKDFCYGKLV